MYDVTTGGRRVAVFAGGDSAERNVSLASGRAVTWALNAAGYLAEMIDPAAIGLYQIDWSRFEACFIALHGGAGEDGRVQAELDSLGVPYTGSGPAASERAMSKSASKERFVAADVPTAEYCIIDGDDGLPTALSWAAATGFPLVVKPDREGSSIGVGYAADAAQLRACVAEARQFDSVVLAERWIDGREFTVAVLGREPLPTLEIVTPRGLFDYEAKYESALTEYRFEHGMSAAAAQRLTDIAVAAAESVDTSGLVRVDLMFDRYSQPWVLEVNTVPGLTDHSLAPKAAAQAGMTMADLCRWMIEDALLAEAKR